MTTDEMLAQMKVWDHALELDRPDLDSLIWILAMDAGLRRALIATGFTQMGFMSMYVALTLLPGNITMLYATILAESFVQSMAVAAFVAAQIALWKGVIDREGLQLDVN